MPTYDFACSSCNHVQEKLMKVSELDAAVDLVCPECGKPTMNRTQLPVNHAYLSPESLGRKKAPEDFRNFLSAIKRAHPGSVIQDH